ncbi:hypothetical protein [Calidifontibacillus oryziterrae]|uniref:hypothetical protein n=1 Tax=Calidifontibacillus oryziterrae TaxID=1191699 RepID=UPI0002E88E87|nr:hypothetical protein [Calidifontibacillus oryziterrae]
MILPLSIREKGFKLYTTLFNELLIRVKSLAYIEKDETFDARIKTETEELVLLFLSMKEEIERNIKENVQKKYNNEFNEKGMGLHVQVQEQQMKLYKEKEQLKTQLENERKKHQMRLEEVQQNLLKTYQEKQELQRLLEGNHIVHEQLSNKITQLEKQTENLQANLEFEIRARKEIERQVYQDQTTR